MNKALKKIVIVGGGTAGWLTAGILAAEHNSRSPEGIAVTLIESPEISTIGVGEGTWPTMRNTLQNIGISENEFFRCCDASFKQGSEFIGWVTGEKNDSFYHPFIAPHGFGQCNLTSHWLQSKDNIPFAHAISFQPHLCDAGCAPKQIQTPEFAAVANYGYHLNATKFAKLLQEHCTKKLGVKHVVDHVIKINGHIDDDIQSLTTKEQGEIAGDLFVDCSGTASILLAKHYQIPFISKKHILFNDSAIAVQVPYSDKDDVIKSHTLSTAQEAGWIWDIGLPTRRGIGHTYSSVYQSDLEAELVLKTYLAKDLTTASIEQLRFRKLSFEPGHREKFWHKNCVAVGMASGFLEPLEASALALVELSAKMISKELPTDHAIMAITAKRFNQRFTYRWQRIIEFLKLHYVLSKRQNSQYWRDNRENASIPERLTELLQLWQYQEPSFNDFTEIEEIFPSASYQYILYGMGFKTQVRTSTKKPSDEAKALHFLQENYQLGQKYQAGLPSNRALITHIINTGLPK